MRELIKIGSISTTKGLKGEFKVYALDEELYYLEVGDQIFIEGVFENLYIEKITMHKDLVVLKLENYNRIDQVKSYKNQNVFIDSKNIKLEKSDEILADDLLGFEVINEENCVLGKVVNVIGSKVQAVLVIENGDNEWMLPYVEKFVVDIVIDEKRIIVDPIEGMVE